MTIPCKLGLAPHSGEQICINCGTVLQPESHQTSNTDLREPRGGLTPSEYAAIHTWVKNEFGKASLCEQCGRTDGRLEWSNKTNQYLKDRSDWQMLCATCHRVYDQRKPFCKNGHKLEGSNAHVPPKGNQLRCNKCNREQTLKWQREHPEIMKARSAKYRANRKARLAQLQGGNSDE